MDITTAIAKFNRDIQAFNSPVTLISGNGAGQIIASAKMIINCLEPTQELNECYLELEEAGIDFDTQDFGDSNRVNRLADLFLNEVKTIRAMPKVSNIPNAQISNPSNIHLHINQNNNQETNITNENNTALTSIVYDFSKIYNDIEKTNPQNKKEIVKQVKIIEKEVKKETPNKGLISSTIKVLKENAPAWIVSSIFEIIKKIFGF